MVSLLLVASVDFVALVEPFGSINLVGFILSDIDGQDSLSSLTCFGLDIPVTKPGTLRDNTAARL